MVAAQFGDNCEGLCPPVGRFHSRSLDVLGGGGACQEIGEQIAKWASGEALELGAERIPIDMHRREFLFRLDRV